MIGLNAVKIIVFLIFVKYKILFLLNQLKKSVLSLQIHGASHSMLTSASSKLIMLPAILCISSTDNATSFESNDEMNPSKHITRTNDTAGTANSYEC